MDNNDFSILDTLSDDDFTVDPNLTKINHEERKKQEISEVLKKFKDSAKNENKLFLDNTDSEYWVAICFQSREQKEAFLSQAGWKDLGDKYLDGLQVAEQMGIDITNHTPGMQRANINKKWSGLT